MSTAVKSCPWVGDDPLYRAYHDEEWGVPEYDDRALYEKLILDGFQAGLSWITILRKRENFRRAFGGFRPERVARFGARDVTRLMNDAGIIRNRPKIDAAINGARLWLDIMEKESGGFSDLVWKHVDGRPQMNRVKRMGDIPAKTEMSEKLSKELKGRGFKFCGPVIVYAFAQAVGMVNDHIVSCHRYAKIAALAAQPRPR
ncbi:MAG TPA: DNA-3-methyladenine glycosylase I [Micropepsaceae bacterium]|nr:DNA-3-methyladenine glycosylase I [Micropepsaceae bacterium]